MKKQPIKIERGALSCWATRTTARGRWLSCSHFDVPCEDDAEGNVTGARLALELVRLVRAAAPDDLQAIGWEVWSTIRDAASVRRGDGRHGASVGFMWSMQCVLMGAILHGNGEDLAAARLRAAERDRDYYAKIKKEDAAEFVQRMKIARAASASRRGAA